MSLNCTAGVAAGLSPCSVPSGLGSTEVAIMLALVGVAIAALLALLVALFVWRKTRTLHSASPLFCALIAIGGLVAMLSNMVLALPRDAMSCAATTWLVHLGFTISFGSLFIKTQRLASIFYVRYRTHLTIILIACMRCIYIHL
jgi:hypothetical protein